MGPYTIIGRGYLLTLTLLSLGVDYGVLITAVVAGLVEGASELCRRNVLPPCRFLDPAGANGINWILAVLGAIVALLVDGASL